MIEVDDQIASACMEAGLKVLHSKVIDTQTYLYGEEFFLTLMEAWLILFFCMVQNLWAVLETYRGHYTIEQVELWAYHIQ